MFSGKTGAVVPSGYGPVTTEPTYELARDATKVVRNLPSVLFDKNVKHRPCGLLCKIGVAGMLIIWLRVVRFRLTGFESLLWQLDSTGCS